MQFLRRANFHKMFLPQSPWQLAFWAQLLQIEGSLPESLKYLQSGDVAWLPEGFQIPISFRTKQRHCKQQTNILVAQKDFPWSTSILKMEVNVVQSWTGSPIHLFHSHVDIAKF